MRERVVVEGLRPSEVARRLGVSEALVRLFLRQGRLGMIETPLGRLVPEAEVERLAQERAGQPRRGRRPRTG